MPKKTERQLTEVELHYIKSKSEELSAEQIAHKLEVPVELVQSNMPKPETRFMKNINKKAAGGRKGLVVMTETASQISDAKPANIKNKLTDCIHKTMGEDYGK